MPFSLWLLFTEKKTIVARPIKARAEFEKYQILKRSEDFSNESYTKESSRLH